MGILAAYSFISFLFYRIATSVAFNDPLSVLACALVAVISTLIAFVFSGYAATALVKLAFSRVMEGSKATRFSVLIWPITGATFANVVVCFLIALGFSASHFEEASYWSTGYYSPSIFEQNLLWAIVIYSLPMAIYVYWFSHSLKIAPVVNAPMKSREEPTLRKRKD